MTKPVDAAEIEAALTGAIPHQLTFTVERSDDSICVTLPEQHGVPWELHVGWEGVTGEGEHLLWIFSDPLKYEELSLEPLDRQALSRLRDFVADLLSGEIAVETTRFRSSGKLWRTRLLDPREPEGEQVIYRYYSSVLRWWRPVRTEIVRLGKVGKDGKV